MINGVAYMSIGSVSVLLHSVYPNLRYLDHSIPTDLIGILYKLFSSEF